MNDVSMHATVVEVSNPVPQEKGVGTDVALSIEVSCSSRCDLRGKPVTIATPNGLVMTAELAKFEAMVNKTEVLTIKAPNEVGEYTWKIMFPRDEAQPCIHEESCKQISIVTKPHIASIAVWGIPSSVVINSSFNVNVGIKCLIGCSLAGNWIEILNDSGAKVGEGRLGDHPWPGTESLYWTSVDVKAPGRDGVNFWTPRFVTTGSTLAHEVAGTQFSFRTVQPPEHTATVQVLGETTGLPIEDLEVWVGPYHSFTNDRGIAIIELPTGKYTVDVRKEGYGTEQMIVEVNGDIAIPVKTHSVPTKALVEGPVGPYHPYRD